MRINSIAKLFKFKFIVRETLFEQKLGAFEPIKQTGPEARPRALSQVLISKTVKKWLE